MSPLFVDRVYSVQTQEDLGEGHHLQLHLRNRVRGGLWNSCGIVPLQYEGHQDVHLLTKGVLEGQYRQPGCMWSDSRSRDPTIQKEHLINVNGARGRHLRVE